MTNKIIRRNPNAVPAPVGEYSHITVIPANSTLYTFSGQIGIDSSGTIPKTHRQQVEYTFVNMRRVLEAEGLTAENVIKVNIWSVEEIDWEHFDAIWHDFFPENPSMTIVYVAALGLPELSIEIDLLAAKPQN